MTNRRSTFRINSIFRTIQGEGYNSGRAAVFVRFSGCNGWSGINQNRDKGPLPCSRWCDTSFRSGTNYHLDDLIENICDQAAADADGFQGQARFVVLTGGEPALQVTKELVDLLVRERFDVAIETNGTIALPDAHMWITVSPKTYDLKQRRGNELKLIHPTLDPARFVDLDFKHFFLQPLDDLTVDDKLEYGETIPQTSIEACVEYIERNPYPWRLSMQIHKILGIP